MACYGKAELQGYFMNKMVLNQPDKLNWDPDVPFQINLSSV